jgi:flagellar hook assembly protein FlgD
VEITLYDRQGRVVRNVIDQDMGAGAYTASWDGKDDEGQTVTAGVYHAVIKEAGKTRKLKVIVLK